MFNKKDKNGVPIMIKTPIYYVIDKDSKNINYDVETMKKEFDKRISILPQYNGDKNDL